MTAYGQQVTLQEILEELAFHCYTVDPKRPKIQIILPEAVIRDFSRSFKPMEKFISATGEDLREYNIRTLVVQSGEIELFSDDKSQVTNKDLK